MESPSNGLSELLLFQWIFALPLFPEGRPKPRLPHPPPGNDVTDVLIALFRYQVSSEG